VKEPLLTVALLTGAASAQSRTFYDASGKVVDRASTDSAGSTTFYDERGRRRPESPRVATRQLSTTRAVALSKDSRQSAKVLLGIVGVLQLFHLSPCQRRGFLDGVLPRECGGTHPA
jgi:hypothetical protein